MSDDAAPARLPAWFFVALTGLASFFLALGIVRADRTTLRGDECLGILQNRADPGALDLLLRGKPVQISPAPLYYIVHQIANAARAKVGYLGLSPSGYYRLPVLLLSAGLGVAAAIVVALRVRRTQPGAMPLVLVLCAIAVFWFQPKSFAFAGLARPYGLWNGLWLLALALLLFRPKPGIAAVVLSLTAATATGSCFQILALGIALVVVRRVEQRPWKDVLREGALLLGAPALIAAYYALRSPPFDMDDREPAEAASDFLKFWLITNLTTWAAAAQACALTLSRPKLRDYALPAAALAALVLLMPLIFGLTRLKGYTSPSRQYIWTGTAIPLLMMLGALAWSELRIRRTWGALAIVIALFFLAYTPLKLGPRKDSRELACLRPDSDLMRLLKVEKPRTLRVRDSMKAIEQSNVFFIGEWIDVRYGDRLRGPQDILFADDHGRLEAKRSPMPYPDGWNLVNPDPAALLRLYSDYER